MRQRLVLVTLLCIALQSSNLFGQQEPASPTLSLAQALAELDRDNPTIEQAAQRVEGAAGLVRQARGALLPTLVASGSYVRNSSEARIDFARMLPALPPGVEAPEIVIQPLDAFSATLALRVPLFVPRAYFELRSLEHTEQAARAHAESVRANLRLALSQAAYATAALGELVRASEHAVELAVEHVQSSERRVQAGTASALDVLRARADHSRRESERVRVRAELERAELLLGVLLGRRGPVRVVVADIEPGPLPTAEAAEQRALANRPELEALRAESAAAGAQVDAARARFWPELAVTGAAFASDEPYPTGDRTGYRVAVELSVPLYDGGVRYGKRRQAEASVEVARSAMREKELEILQQLADARRDVSTAHERLRLARVQRTLVSEAAASAKRSFDAGIATTLDVLDANDRLYQAEVLAADAQARLAQAWFALQRALGER
jgi:outer membrane protein TolC